MGPKKLLLRSAQSTTLHSRLRLGVFNRNLTARALQALDPNFFFEGLGCGLPQPRPALKKKLR